MAGMLEEGEGEGDEEKEEEEEEETSVGKMRRKGERKKSSLLLPTL